MTTWHIGTVGFGYRQWLGTFYPEKMPSKQFLRHYAQFFNSAEIDSTFYGTPRESTVYKWLRDASSPFTFSPKTPRDITHNTPIQSAAPAMLEFIERLRAMGDQLGAILIQYPASFQANNLTALDQFLASLPTTVRYAVEFRHPSWQNDDTIAMLAQHNACFIAADYGTTNEHNMAEFAIHPTTDWLYLRFIGRHGAFNTKNEVKLDQKPRLERWLTELKPHFPNLNHIYAYFNNDYSGYSIHTTNLLKQLLGLDYAHPEIATQPTLF